MQNDKIDPEKLKKDREELEKRQREGGLSLANVPPDNLGLLILASLFLCVFCICFLQCNQGFLLLNCAEKARLHAEAKAAEVTKRKAQAQAAILEKQKKEVEREEARRALQQVCRLLMVYLFLAKQVIYCSSVIHSSCALSIISYVNFCSLGFLNVAY
jgi:hypothetical protein